MTYKGDWGGFLPPSTRKQTRTQIIYENKTPRSPKTKFFTFYFLSRKQTPKHTNRSLLITYGKCWREVRTYTTPTGWWNC